VTRTYQPLSLKIIYEVTNCTLTLGASLSLVAWGFPDRNLVTAFSSTVWACCVRQSANPSAQIEHNNLGRDFVNTKRERFKYLASRLDLLSKQIQDAKREDEYLELVKDIAQGLTQPPSIDEDAWNLMLPKEQESNLLLHYHTMRAEASLLTEELKKPTALQTVKDVLDSPYVKGPITVFALVKIAVAVVALASTMGLFFKEDDPTNKSFFV
jgi:hypothetical protein